MRKMTVTLDPVVVKHAVEDVEGGRAKSVSAWLNAAARARIEREDARTVLAEIFEQTGGPLTSSERAAARKRLSDAGGA